MAEQQTRPNRSRQGERFEREQSPYNEQVISVDRVSRVVKGGRRFRFRALVAVGDNKSTVGVGVAKAGDVQSAVTKAIAVAKKNFVTFPLTKQESIPHEINERYSGAQILLKPAAPGTGIIAGGVVRSILDVTGIQNVLSKSIGSSNKINTAYATIAALDNLVQRSDWITTPEPKPKKPTQSAKPKASKKAAK
jgi:small subunit ribosomal protein S5